MGFKDGGCAPLLLADAAFGLIDASSLGSKKDCARALLGEIGRDGAKGMMDLVDDLARHTVYFHQVKEMKGQKADSSSTRVAAGVILGLVDAKKPVLAWKIYTWCVQQRGIQSPSVDELLDKHSPLTSAHSTRLG